MTGFVRVTAEPFRPAPPAIRKSLAATLFGDVASTAATLAITAVALAALPQLLSWAVLHGVWQGDGDVCRGAGACWSYLRAKAPFILFGIYPADERWRPLVSVAMIAALTLWTMPRSHWTRCTLCLWALGISAALALMAGGFAGLEAVPTSAWGGLPITVLLTVLSLAIGFPLAVALAMGRRSRMLLTRYAATAFIEIVRGLPLLSMLFVAAILLPLMLPDGVTLDNLFRALVALTASCAAYLAEVVRGGLQSVPRGQEEAARSLGFGRWAAMRLIVLPQAIRAVIPPLTNTAVVVVKNTSLVLVVGLFDLLSAGRAALSDPDWPAPYVETYLMIALIYFLICFGLARYALVQERYVAEARA